MAFPNLGSIDFKGLYWYQFSALISAIILIVSLFYPVQAFDQKNVITLSLGSLRVSIGEWRNRLWQVESDGKSLQRVNKPSGIILDIVGLIIILTVFLEAVGFDVPWY